MLVIAGLRGVTAGGPIADAIAMYIRYDNRDRGEQSVCFAFTRGIHDRSRVTIILLFSTRMLEHVLLLMLSLVGRRFVRVLRTMPPTRRVSTTVPETVTTAVKRPRTKKESESATEDADTPPVKPAPVKRKKAVVDSDSASAPRNPDTLADESLPKNVDIPATLEYPRPASEGHVRIAAWNITSLKSAEPKGMMRYIVAEDADIIVLSETKVNDVPMHPALSNIYKHQYWGIGKTKGYAGLAILSKIQPVKATYGLPGLADQDTKGRISKLQGNKLDCRAKTDTRVIQSRSSFNTRIWLARTLSMQEKDSRYVLFPPQQRLPPGSTPLRPSPSSTPREHICRVWSIHKPAFLIISPSIVFDGGGPDTEATSPL